MGGGDTSCPFPSFYLGKKKWVFGFIIHLSMSLLIGRLFYPFLWVKVLSIWLHVDCRVDKLKSVELGRRGEGEAADVSC